MTIKLPCTSILHLNLSRMLIKQFFLQLWVFIEWRKGNGKKRWNQTGIWWLEEGTCWIYWYGYTVKCTLFLPEH